jgi:hypothetical protein
VIRFSNLPISKKKYSKKNYPELEIQNSCPKQYYFMGGNFKFQVLDSFLEYIFLGDLEI